MAETEIGKISHYFGKIEVGIIELTAALNVGETIHIKGVVTDFTQKIDSMQINREDVEKGEKGDGIGVKLTEKVRVGDIVFKVEEE